MKLSIISFNCMGLFSFDSLHGFLLSLNIKDRLNTAGEHLAKESADVILLQEVNTYFALHLLKKKLSDYPFFAYQNYLFGPRGGLVIVSKYPLNNISYSNFKKRGSWLHKSIVGHIIKNGILQAELYNEKIVVCSTHLTPNMDYDHSKDNRYAQISEAQLTQLTEITKQFVKEGKHVLIGGDFNIDKNSYLYDLFFKQSHEIDLFKKYDSPTKIQEFYPKGKHVERLDYLFHVGTTKPKNITTTHLFTKKMKINRTTTTYLSDHIGLKATLIL